LKDPQNLCKNSQTLHKEFVQNIRYLMFDLILEDMKNSGDKKPLSSAISMAEVNANRTHQ